MRVCRVAIIKVFCQGKSLWQSKRKDSQVVEGISERIEPHESFFEGAVRGLNEELNIQTLDLQRKERWHEEKFSESRQCQTHYIFQEYYLFLDSETLPTFPSADGGVEFEWR